MKKTATVIAIAALSGCATMQVPMETERQYLERTIAAGTYEESTGGDIQTTTYKVGGDISRGGMSCNHHLISRDRGCIVVEAGGKGVYWVSKDYNNQIVKLQKMVDGKIDPDVNFKTRRDDMPGIISSYAFGWVKGEPQAKDGPQVPYYSPEEIAANAASRAADSQTMLNNMMMLNIGSQMMQRAYQPMYHQHLPITCSTHGRFTTCQ